MPTNSTTGSDLATDSVSHSTQPAPAPVEGAEVAATIAARPARRPQPAQNSYEPPSYATEQPLNTVLFDSIAADTIPGDMRFMSVAERDSLMAAAEAQARADSLNRTIILIRPSNSNVGEAPETLAPNYTHSTALAGVLAGALALAALNAGAVGRTLKRYRHDLWSIRKRSNVFDDSHAVSLRGAALLALVFCVFGGVVLYNIATDTPSPSFSGVMIAMGVLAGYYVAQLCVYGLIGYAFSSPLGCRQWLRGFAASQAFAGIGLIIPALLLINVPEWRNVLLIISLVIYFLFRAVFILKGFRIFYRNFESWLYFILYLCSIEIIPPVGITLLLQSILRGTL